TDANSATLLTSDCDEYDRRFLTGERTTEGFFHVKSGVEAAIARALAYALYADLLWFETSKPDIEEARCFAEAVHARFPRKLLAYNCSPSFNWKKHLTKAQIAAFQKELGSMGYKFQFVTLSAFHALNHSLWLLAKEFKERGMAAYADLQEREFTSERDGYEAIRHQEFVGVGYFDEVTQVATNGKSTTLAMEGSTEREQFRAAPPAWTTGTPATTRSPSRPNVRPARQLGKASRRGITLFLDGFPGRFAVSFVSCVPHVAILPAPVPRVGQRAARPGCVPTRGRVRDGPRAAPRRSRDGARDAEPARRVLRLPTRR